MVTLKPEMNHSVQSISELLSTSSASLLRVPDYQRSYSWARRQYKELWDDLEEFTFDDATQDATYFLGAVVFVSEDDLDILDGQQRLTTATILLTSLTRFLKAEGEAEYADDVFGSYVAKRQRGGPQTMYKLVLNRHDEAFFRQLVQEPDGTDPVPSTQSHKNISACKAFFDGQLRAWKREYGDAAVQRAKTLADALLDRVFAVTITAFNLSAAGYVFERLNDRGIGLNAVDLVRSLVMQRCGEANRNIVLQGWAEIFTTESPANVDDLLRFHWVSRYGDATSNTLYKLIRENFKAGKPGFDAMSFTTDLRDAARVYKSIYASAQGGDSFADICAKVVELNAKPLVPLLMKINGFATDRRDMVAKVALLAFVRNRLVANQSSTTFEDVVYAVARDIADDNESVVAARGSFATLAYVADDDDFRRAFSIRDLATQKQAAFLLRGLEDFLRREKGHDELVIAPSQDVHVEHIYPRNPQADQRWEGHDDLVDRIGNQTLWSGERNREAQNEPFEQKKPRYATSELLLTRELSEFDQWDPKAIQSRQDRLADLAVKVWPKDA